MKKEHSIRAAFVTIVAVIMLLPFAVYQDNSSTYVSEQTRGKTLELIIENDAGDVIDPSFSYIYIDDKVFVQFDGLIDATEILGLDEDYTLADDIETLLEIDGEWLLVDDKGGIDQIVAYLSKYASTSTPITSDSAPLEYLISDNFEQIFYNIIDERIIKG